MVSILFYILYFFFDYVFICFICSFKAGALDINAPKIYIEGDSSSKDETEDIDVPSESVLDPSNTSDFTSFPPLREDSTSSGGTDVLNLPFPIKRQMDSLTNAPPSKRVKTEHLEFDNSFRDNIFAPGLQDSTDGQNVPPPSSDMDSVP